MNSYLKKQIPTSLAIFIILFFALITASICIFRIKEYQYSKEAELSTVSAISATISGLSSLTPPISGDLLFKDINKAFSQDYVFPLDLNKPIYSLSINASVNLKEGGLVRVVLVDKNGNEYLVYEGHQLITDLKNNQTSFRKICEESCVLDAIVPSSLKIQLEEADIKIEYVLFSDSFNDLSDEVKKKGIKNYAKELKKSQDRIKIEKINKNIKAAGKNWTAGETSVSQLTYSEKKILFKNPERKEFSLPNLRGFEYYVSGVFDMSGGRKPTGTSPSTPSDPPPPPGDAISYPVASVIPTTSWDWRNRHGENWITPVRNQGSCASCWAFSAVGATEANINLYYNQHLNADVSEQDSVCRHAGSCSNGGYLSWTLSELKNGGLTSEACLPYRGNELAASCTKCSDWQSLLWQITNYGSLSTDDDTIKNALIQKGPITFGINSWWHFMTLVGYDKDASTGQTIWILKNSWGTGWGENGYGKIIVSSSDRYGINYVEKPFFTANPASYQTNCQDKDLDGYCNWGLSAIKPSSCTATCNQEKDCDDSNSSIAACQITQEVKPYLSTCREYQTAQCTQDTGGCPTGYIRSSTSKICAQSGKNKTYWSYCVKDFKYCGKCPIGSFLASYSYCPAGQICSLNQCAAQ